MDLSTIFSAESDIPSPLPNTFWTRLHGIWLVLWTGLVMIPFGIGAVIIYRIHPSLHTFKKWLEWWAHGMLLGVGIRVRTIIEQPLDQEQSYLFISNHQCAVDIPIHSAALPYPFSFLAKKSLIHAPALGFVLRNTPHVLVDLSTPRRAVAGIQEAGKRIREGHSLLIYPEGKRTFAPRLTTFMRGAFVLAVSAGVPIVPVTLLDSYRVVDERVLRTRPGVVHMHVGKPISVEGKSRKDVPALMQQVRDQMQEILDRGPEELNTD